MPPLLSLEAFRAAPLTREPFSFVIATGFLNAEAKPALDADYPRIDHAGSYPVEGLKYGPAFASLLRELQGPEFREAVSEKFEIDLEGRPTIVTVRGRARRRDGRIHTDTASKLISVLIYMNTGWRQEGGRLRLLRSAHNLEDTIAEVPPEWGNLVAFRRSDQSFHGHKHCDGPRRVVQLNWVTDPAVVEREVIRHSLTGRLKRLLDWASGSY